MQRFLAALFVTSQTTGQRTDKPLEVDPHDGTYRSVIKRNKLDFLNRVRDRSRSAERQKPGVCAD